MIRSKIRAIRWRVRDSLPGKALINIEFLKRHRRLPRLDPPETFCEKIVHRKLYDRDPRMVVLADKISAKERVAELIGEEWTIPNLWTGDALPPRSERSWPIPYVLKASHGCGWNYFVRSPEEQDWEQIEAAAAEWLQTTYGRSGREWLYTEIEPRLLVEPYIGRGEEAPPDYKFFVFGGQTRYVQVDVGRSTDHEQHFYDMDWNRQPWEYICPYREGHVDKPRSFEKMVWAANRLGEGFPFVRVDLYEVDGKPFFGECTFYPNGGGTAFKPEHVEKDLGSFWLL